MQTFVLQVCVLEFAQRVWQVPIEEHQTGNDECAHIKAVQAWVNKWPEMAEQQDRDELYHDCHQQK